MNQPYTLKLNINIPLFKSDLHPVEVLKTVPVWTNNVIANPPLATHFSLPEEYLSSEIKDFFIQQQVMIDVVEIFYMVPGDILAIHSDGVESGDFTKINWIFGGKNSEMVWFDKIDPNMKGKSVRSYRDTGALHYTRDEVIITHREHLEGPNLVQVGCPHTVINPTEERFCFSLVFRNNIWNRPTMEKSIDIFKDLII